MKPVALFLSLVVCAGCSSDDVRLHGTWRSNREATVAEIFRADAHWATASPEKRAKLADLFGNLSVTFSNRVITTLINGKVDLIGYRVVSRGSDYEVIHFDEGLDAGADIRIRFVDGGSAYWIGGGVIMLGMQERFDRVADQSTK